VSADVRAAARLLYKALQLMGSPANDQEYRELLSRYRADGAFAEVVQEQAAGLELVILDVSERGLILAPANRDSRFSLRMGDLRQHLTKEQKVALVLAHLAISAVVLFRPRIGWKMTPKHRCRPPSPVFGTRC